MTNEDIEKLEEIAAKIKDVSREDSSFASIFYMVIAIARIPDQGIKRVFLSQLSEASFQVAKDFRSFVETHVLTKN